MTEAKRFGPATTRCKTCGHVRFEHFAVNHKKDHPGGCVRGGCICPGYLAEDRPKIRRSKKDKPIPFGEGSMF